MAHRKASAPASERTLNEGRDSSSGRPTVQAKSTCLAKQSSLTRTTFKTSRLLDFCSEKELIAQTGHRPAQWPLVVFKELTDNALDACEEAGIAPEIIITVDKTGITVADN